METDDIHKDINVDQMLLEVSENPLSDKTEVVKNLLISNKELFSQNCLDQSLLSCCRKGTILLVPDIISAGANLEVTDENGNTPLLVAAFCHNESCVMYLLRAGANVNVSNFDGDTPLIVSVLNSSYIGITKLLVGSQDINIHHANNKGFTAPIYAIETANFNAIKLLIDAIDILGLNEVSYDTVLKDNENRNTILSLINLFKLHKSTGKSLFLHAALNRDLESARIIISMDKSIVSASKDSLASIMIEFLESIEENKNVVDQTEVEIFEILLTHATGKFISSEEKEMIMDVAVSIGDCELVERLLKFKYIISFKNLSSAVSNSDFLRFLLSKKPDINKFNRQNKPVYHDSPLRIAMLEEEIESARLLIQHGAFFDIDQALKDVVKWNQEKVLQFLISEFPDQVGQKLKYPKMLHDAVINSSLNIIPILLDNGTDINATYNKKYCLTQAVDVNVLELLLSRGADPNVKMGIKRYTYPIHKFLSQEFKNTLRKKWTTLGNHTISNSSLSNEIKDFVECLLRHGAQVDLQDDQGQTALHIAASKYTYVPILKILIDSGAGVNKTDYKGESPLRNALINENAEMVECLLRHGAQVDQKDSHGQTALHIAAIMNSSVPIVKRLINFNADVNQTDHNGDTPLQIALENRNANVQIECLIKAGADVNCVNKSTDKPFIFEIRNETILKIFLDNGVSVKPIDGESPLNSLLAKRYIGMESVKRLIDAGCDVNHVNKDGDTVLIHAAKYIYRDLLELLVKEGADVNASGRKFPYKTAIASLIIKLWNCQEEAISCINYLLDQKANNDKVDPCVIHVFITSGSLSLIPRFISCGFAPSYLSIGKYRFSPLLMAIFLKQTDLVEYFMKIQYFMKSDINVLQGKLDSPIDQKYFAKHLKFMIVQSPLSLETLCLIVLSDTLGNTQDRFSKVERLEIPHTLRNALLFQNGTRRDIKDVGERHLYYFKHSLQQLNLYHVKSDDEDKDYFDEGDHDIYW